jgi:hypothetical protein
MANTPVTKIPRNVSEAEWERWMSGDGQQLVELGIPTAILSKEYLWLDFLCSGRLERHPGISEFTFDDIKRESMPCLLEILLASYPRSEIGECDLAVLLWRVVRPDKEIWDSD